MAEITVRELMSRMPRALKVDMVQGVDAVIQYHLTGSEASDWIIEIKDGVCKVEEGNHPNPKMTLAADSDDYKNVILGNLNAMQAFMTGKVKLAGDLNLAMKLPNWFKLGSGSS
jgi:putative sterol carrier protein